MKRKRSGISYLLIALVAIIVIAVSATIFSSYIDEQTRSTVELSSFIALESSNTSRDGEVSENTDSENTIFDSSVVSSTANDILQLLSQSVNAEDQEQVELVYHQFTKEQLDGISLEEYQNYISLLKEVINSKVISYSTMSYTEASEVARSMRMHSNAYEEFLKTASYHKLEYLDKNNKAATLTIILSKDEEDKTYLSNKWVRGSLELRNFSGLYFSAVREKNFEILHRLTYSNTLDSDIRLQKTKQLMSFYEKYIDVNKISNQEVISLRMDEIRFALPLKNEKDKIDLSEKVVANSDAEERSDITTVTSESVLETRSEGEESLANEIEELNNSKFSYDGDSEYTFHEVSIYKNENNFTSIDVVPSDAWKYDAIALKNDGEILRVGDLINVSELYRKFAWPKEQVKISFGENPEEPRPYYRLVFADLEVFLQAIDKAGSEGKITASTQFKIVGFVLKNSKYNLAGEYFLNKSIDNLMETYLYIDALGFTYQDDENNEVKIILDDSQIVKSIEVKSSDLLNNLVLYKKSESVVDLFEAEKETIENTNKNESTTKTSTSKTTSQTK